MTEDQLAEAVERVLAMFHGNYAGMYPSRDAVLAALFPAPEPEPEEWISEAATTWFRIPRTDHDAAALARHFAKARRERGKP